MATVEVYESAGTGELWSATLIGTEMVLYGGGVLEGYRSNDASAGVTEAGYSAPLNETEAREPVTVTIRKRSILGEIQKRCGERDDGMPSGGAAGGKNDSLDERFTPSG